MTVGMSAPPMGRISSTPKIVERPAKMGKIHVSPGDTMSRTPSPAATAKRMPFITFWLRYVIGRVGSTS